MSELLTEDQVNAELAGLTGWSREGDAIVRTANLPSFPAAIAVVDRVATIAEARDHHPDIDIRWRTLIFRCSTHSAGGLTAKDLALAHEINAILTES